MPLRQRDRDPRPRDRRRPWRPDRRALTALPLALIVLITVVDILSPPDIHLGPLLIVTPALTASLAGARATAGVAVLALAALTIVGTVREGGITSANIETQLGAQLAVSVLIVALRVLRDRHERELARVRSVSEAAQRVLLRPLPDRIGPLHLASVYLAAEAEAQVGGDLYAAARTPTGTRLLVGDVRGKGLSSLGDAALLLGAFRAAAHLHAELPGLAAYLDGSVCWDLAQLSAQANRLRLVGGSGDGPPEEAGADDSGEAFITAVLLDIPDDGTEVRLIDCGHPPPLLLRADGITPLAADHPAPPLGLGELAPGEYRVEVFPFRPGDRLLIYTDGVIEARDARKRFYPLTERVTAWQSDRPSVLLHRLRRDLLAHVGGHLDDDAAMVVVERLPDE
ncbi:PP2C family protein-serine/threonine phosphatase [Streptomyces sp. SP17BM10]|uniref:PP2C family protein-serine/threonine phosphatase n=1 Tax=Streptomyces sp. SP17BM10 TaxID=3002530 RepID=UPI002E7A0CB6|nr:PP2C family protein-serine/threonine phosphatase [Streptomyces sp. SP17BM10]MEE1787637.1 PP2C family protein-serine/threonine phosphatase [Streptomyces sp. SP17BM10]